MTRTFKTLSTLFLGALLLASAGCQDKATQDALKTCRSDLANVQKTSASQTSTINNLKSQLAQAQAKVQALTAKEAEAAKTPEKGKEMEMKGKAEKGKKAEAKGKKEKKAAKGKRKAKKKGAK